MERPAEPWGDVLERAQPREVSRKERGEEEPETGEE